MLKTDHGARSARPDAEAALEIGIKALAFIAAEPEQLPRFLALSGLDVGQLRAASREPAFFAGLLDYVLAHEKTLMSFCETADLKPPAVEQARDGLSATYGGVPR